jgi:hypothetical protein
VAVAPELAYVAVGLIYKFHVSVQRQHLHYFLYQYFIRLAHWQLTHAAQHHHGNNSRVIIPILCFCEEEKGTVEERVW